MLDMGVDLFAHAIDRPLGRTQRPVWGWTSPQNRKKEGGTGACEQ